MPRRPIEEENIDSSVIPYAYIRKVIKVFNSMKARELLTALILKEKYVFYDEITNEEIRDIYVKKYIEYSQDRQATMLDKRWLE